MHYKLMHPGNYLEAADLGGKPVTVTIEGVRLEDLEEEAADEDGKRTVKRKKRKGLISFVGKHKGLIPARTVSECLRAMFGPETDGWIGKRVTLKPDVVDKRGKFYGDPCVRVAGSPDIDHDITFELRLPKCQPKMVTLTKTASKAPPTASAASSPAVHSGNAPAPEVPPQPALGAAPSKSPGDSDGPPPDAWRSEEVA